MLMQLLDFFSQCNYVYISLQENNCFLTIKIIYRDGKIDLEQLEKFLISSFPDKNKFIMDEHNTNRIRFVINMEKYYGENDY